MNERQPYDKLLADKLQQLRGPDVDESWQRMKQLLDDEQRPKGGGKNNSNGWWRIGIIAIVLVGSVLFFMQDKTSGDKQIAAAPPASEKGQTASANNSNDKLNQQKTTSTGDKSTLGNADNKNGQNDASTNKEHIAVENNKDAAANAPVATNSIKPVEKNIAEKNSKTTEKLLASNNLSDRTNKSNNKLNDISRTNTNTPDKISNDASLTKLAVAKTQTNGNRFTRKNQINNNHSTTLPGSYTKNVAYRNRLPVANGTQNDPALLEPGRKNGLGNFLPGDNDLVTGRDVLKVSKNESFDQTLESVGTPVADKTETVEATRNDADVSGLVSTASKKSVTDNKQDLVLLKKKKERKSLNLNLGDVFLPFSLKRDGEPWWAVGLSLNSSMTVAGQSRYNYNINAKSGTLSDYLPSPYVQYHMNDNVYVQTELNLSAPQHVPQLLVSQSTIYGPSSTIQTSIYVQKLYYFNWPFSLHYSPVRNLFIAGGLQFSSMQSGVALQERRDVSTGNPTSSIYKFKDDSIAAKLSPNEWRWETGADYYWNRFTLGVRYNKAFKDVLNLNVSSTLPSTINRNSSFLLFMKYNLFEGRDRESRSPSRSLVRW